MFGEEELTLSVRGLSEVHQAFVRGVAESFIGIKTAQDYSRLLSRPDSLELRTTELMDELRQYQVPTEKAENPQIIKAWGVLECFVEQMSPEFRREGIFLWAFGSITYDDPRNLDFDLLATSKLELDGASKRANEWTGKLNTIWEGNRVGTEGHLNYISIARMKQHCEAFQKGWLKYVSDWADNISFDFGGAGIILTGVPIFAPHGDPKWMKQEVWEIAQETPELMAAIILDLEDSLKIRKSRRGDRPSEKA